VVLGGIDAVSQAGQPLRRDLADRTPSTFEFVNFSD
jgi:hypothetical protein